MRSRSTFISLVASAAALLTVSCSSSHPYPDGPPGTISVDGSAPRAVTTLYGQNYWCWNGYGNNMPGVQPLVADLGLKLLRAGGYNNDAEKSTGSYGSDPFGPDQIDAFVAYARAVGAEPILQVPLISNYKRHGGTPTTRGYANPADAAALVEYASSKGYAVKYWEIGNEPDLYANADIPGYTVSDFIADFNAFASAMKTADPSIEILGPELSYKYYPNSADDWLTPFIDGARDGNGKPYYDVITVHRYPFDAARSTRDNAMSDVDNYVSAVQAIQQLIASHAPPGIRFAITEANLTWDGDPTHSGYDASPQTANAAIWVADILAAAREQGLWAQHFWSLSEGWTLGFIDPSTLEPRPEYYAFQMVSKYMGPTELASTPPAGYSVYTSRSASDDATVVLVLNKHPENNEETFVFSRMSGTPAADFSAKFPAYSISVVIFPDGGGAPTIHR